MSVPKSITKVKKQKGQVVVEYTQSVDAIVYTIKELTRGALRDVGKFLVKTYKTNIYSVLHKRTGDIAKNIGYVVGKNYCDLQIGLGRQGKHIKGFYGGFYETGTSRTPKLGVLSKSVYDNLDKIREIESQYLSALNNDNVDKSLIDEDDYEE